MFGKFSNSHSSPSPLYVLPLETCIQFVSVSSPMTCNTLCNMQCYHVHPYCATYTRYNVTLSLLYSVTLPLKVGNYYKLDQWRITVTSPNTLLRTATKHLHLLFSNRKCITSIFIAKWHHINTMVIPEQLSNRMSWKANDIYTVYSWIKQVMVCGWMKYHKIITSCYGDAREVLQAACCISFSIK